MVHTYVESIPQPYRKIYIVTKKEDSIGGDLPSHAFQ